MKDGEILLLPTDGAAAAALFCIATSIIQKINMYSNNLDVLSRHKSSIIYMYDPLSAT